MTILQDLPDPGNEPRCPALLEDSLPTEPMQEAQRVSYWAPNLMGLLAVSIGAAGSLLTVSGKVDDLVSLELTLFFSVSCVFFFLYYQTSH